MHTHAAHVRMHARSLACYLARTNVFATKLNHTHPRIHRRAFQYHWRVWPMHLVHELMHEVGFGKIEIYVDYCDDKVQPFASSLAHAHVSHTHTHTYICIGAFCRFPPPPSPPPPFPPLLPGRPCPPCACARALYLSAHIHTTCVCALHRVYIDTARRPSLSKNGMSPFRRRTGSAHTWLPASDPWRSVQPYTATLRYSSTHIHTVHSLCIRGSGTKRRRRRRRRRRKVYSKLTDYRYSRNIATAANTVTVPAGKAARGFQNTDLRLFGLICIKKSDTH